MNDEKNVHTEEEPVERDLREIERADICVSCGAPVPEGRQVCPSCESGERESGKREIDIFDLIPAEAVVDANRLGFGFLAERGYDALGAWEDEAKCAALERELAERGEELRYSGAYDRDEETGKIVAILIWYSLYDREGRLIARSKGLKLVPKETEADAAGGSDGAKDT